MKAKYQLTKATKLSTGSVPQDEQARSPSPSPSPSPSSSCANSSRLDSDSSPSSKTGEGKSNHRELKSKFSPLPLPLFLHGPSGVEVDRCSVGAVWVAYCDQGRSSAGDWEREGTGEAEEEPLRW